MSDVDSPVREFGVDLPTRIRFGAGVRRSVGPVASAYGPRTVLLTGASFAANPASEASQAEGGQP